MATHGNRWRPDTCGCVVEYTFDDALPPDAQAASHQLRSIQKCPAHAALTDADAYAAVKDENPRKNRALHHLIERFPALVTRKALDGSDEIDPDKVAVSFDPDRVLRLRITGAGAAQKAAIRAALVAHLGAGKAALD